MSVNETVVSAVKYLADWDTDDPIEKEVEWQCPDCGSTTLHGRHAVYVSTDIDTGETTFGEAISEVECGGCYRYFDAEEVEAMAEFLDKDRASARSKFKEWWYDEYSAPDLGRRSDRSLLGRMLTIRFKENIHAGTPLRN